MTVLGTCHPPPHHISTQTTLLISASLCYFKSVNRASCKCLVPSQLLHSSTSHLILLLLGYTGDLTVALEPPECLGPASEDSLQSGEYLTCMCVYFKFFTSLPKLTLVFVIGICICIYVKFLTAHSNVYTK